MSNENFEESESLQNIYYEEMKDFLKATLNASSVRIMHSAVRERPVDFGRSRQEASEDGGTRRRTPLPGLHIGITIFPCHV